MATSTYTADIDYTTATIDDVIRRSLCLHPSLLAEAMASACQTHQQAAATMHDGEARRIAGEMANVARNLFHDIRDSNLDVAALTFNERVIAFTAAARLNCLSRSQMSDIAAREG